MGSKFPFLAYSQALHLPGSRYGEAKAPRRMGKMNGRKKEQQTDLRCEPPGEIPGNDIPKCARVPLFYVGEELALTSGRKFEGAGSGFQRLIIGMHIDEGHSAALSNPVQLVLPDFGC